MGYGTWDLVTAPKDTNIIVSHWTFRVKCDNLGEINRFKSCLIAQGFSQVPGVDFNETYSPTIRLPSIHFILAFACKNNLKLRQIDVKGAYLNGKIDKNVYMQ